MQLRHNYFVNFTVVQKELTKETLEKHSESFSQHVLPMDVIQMLYTEDVISKETFDELDRSRGFLTDGALKALSSVVYEDPNKLRVLCTVLQQSEETVRVATDMLREYGKWYKSILIVLSFYFR